MINQLKRHITNNLISGLSASVIVLCLIVMGRYYESLQITAGQLETVKTTLSRKGVSSHELDTILTRLKVLVPSDLYAKTREEHIFLAIDNLKSRFIDAEVAVANFEDRADTVSMPVTVKGTLKGYSGFVNDIGYLTALKFPFFSINAISLTKKGATVVYVINGAFFMPNSKE